MGLFDRFKKDECLVCGKEVGALGKRKIEDGYICKDCDKKLSPFWHGRKGATLDKINEHLAYREENQAAVEAFQVSRTLGKDDKLLIDDAQGNFIVFRGNGNWREANPDVISLSQVTGAEARIDEDRHEESRTEEEQARNVPPTYTYSFDANLTIHLNHPWFSEIRMDIDSESGLPYAGSAAVEDARRVGEEMKRALTEAGEMRRAQAAEAAKPKQAVTCPHCGATTMPDANGCCEWCGGAIG